MALIGYARVSTEKQDLSPQLNILQSIGCEKIFQDIVSGTKEGRPGLTDALQFMREGDVFVVWRLDRVGRSVSHLISFIQELQAKKVEFRSLKESIDTTTSIGMFFFHVFGALAQFERDLIIERTKAGLEAARLQGRVGGRKKVLDQKKIRKIEELHKKNMSISEISRLLKISRSTIYNYAYKYNEIKLTP
jgi:DNA invertase Pin-like site-specific DNA recombinase